MADAITLLTDHHRTMEQLWDTVQTGIGETRQRAADDLVKLLSQHDALETQLLYPALRRTGDEGDLLADHSLGEHQKVRELLTEVDDADASSIEVLGAWHETMTNVLHHAREEEARVFPLVRSCYDRRHRATMGANMRRLTPMLPTHPHPTTPNNPVAATVAGAVTGLLDKVRDSVRRD